MNFRKINMDVWDRRECFEHFSTVAKSTYSITVDV
ncbi:MAG: CatA-like O-acetyltransferase, partial [Suilimivivens sp.]